MASNKLDKNTIISNSDNLVSKILNYQRVKDKISHKIGFTAYGLRRDHPPALKLMSPLRI